MCINTLHKGDSDDDDDDDDNNNNFLTYNTSRDSNLVKFNLETTQ
jgi:hypothetical protein